MFPKEPEYATAQLIPYLGSKRALVPRLRDLFMALAVCGPGAVFMDPFAGAGSVSRLARSLGMRVRANDWEPYAYILNRAWLTLRPSDLGRMFRREGGLPAVLSRLNSFHPERGDSSPDPEPEPFMARWYAPRDTARADWRTERLFYTRENAVFLDRVRGTLERMAQRQDALDTDPSDLAGRDLVLALLVREAAVHANTSGVFKAFHKGFGGHGRDALNRILGAMELEYPVLPEAEPAEVFREDAARFVRRGAADLVYLDPPYNQHQYGSNYHILNTLVRWDRNPVPLDCGQDGRLFSKAGIPSVWRETHSPYCGRNTVHAALEELLDGLDARIVVLSYNSEGFLTPQEILGLLTARWEVSVEALPYVRYPGGRQSGTRRVRNHELVYVCRTRRPALRTAQPYDSGRLAAELRLRKLLYSRFDPESILRNFEADGESILPGGGAGAWAMWRFHRFSAPDPGIIASLGSQELDRISGALEACEVRDYGHAAAVLAGIARLCAAPGTTVSLPDVRRAVAEALSALRKLAHPRYVREYGEAEAILQALGKEHPALGLRISPGLERLRTQRAERLRSSRG
ncbi:MAG TPA: DNA adenine methylase [Magnetospirillaceae bacterium]|nr:DNA adenine methylase [Magnetospirillaceae bacterium]